MSYRFLRKSLLIMGLVFGLVAACLLFLGSREVPWEMQTWSGNTEKQVAYKKTREWMTRWGFACLFLSFSLQLIGVWGEE